MSVVRCALLLSLVFLPAAASAQSMNADIFYQKAMGLKKKGPMALFSGDIGILMREGQGAGKAAGLARKAALKAGTKPRFCPPSEVRGMDRHEYLDRLGRIPQAERRRIDITEATNRIMAGKFPCAA